MRLPLKGAIVTNIESDHLENYGGAFDQLQDSFLEFINKVEGPVVICIDEPNSKRISEQASLTRNVITVGKTEADFTYEIIEAGRGGISAHIACPNDQTIKIELAVPLVQVG